MEIRKVIMSNGNEYSLLWDDTKIDEEFFNMIDIETGWVSLKKHFISEITPYGRLKDHSLSPKIKKEIEEHYEGAFVEYDDRAW